MFKFIPTSKLRPTGFTLIELLIVIAIIGILSTLAVIALSNARVKSRDAKRVADMKQISTALELYYNDNVSYPTIITPGNSLVSPDGNITYMGVIPSNPTPRNDGTCGNSDYLYAISTNNNYYNLSFCLGGASGALSGGNVNYSSSGPINQAINNSSLAAWFMSDSGVQTRVSGDDTFVTAWNDLSGNSNHTSQANTDYQPKLINDSINSKPAVRFDGSNDTLIKATSTIRLRSGAKTIFTVAKVPTTTSRECVFSTGYELNFEMNVWPTNNSFGVHGFISPGGSKYGTGGWRATNAATWVITEAVWQENSMISDIKLYHNGLDVTAGGSSTAADIPDTYTKINIGSRNGNSEFYSSDIAEIIIYDRYLSNSERDQIELYLSNKYNLTLLD
jgi:prepilin-type N-terminal cleavage/methylation domain-containing protein